MKIRVDPVSKKLLPGLGVGGWGRAGLDFLQVKDIFQPINNYKSIMLCTFNSNIEVTDK